MFQTVKPSCVTLFLLAFARGKRSIATETGRYTCQQLNRTKPSNPGEIVSDKAGLRRMRGSKSAVRANTCLKILSIFCSCMAYRVGRNWSFITGVLIGANHPFNLTVIVLYVSVHACFPWSMFGKVSIKIKRLRARAHACVCMRTCVCARVRVCMCMYMRACVYVVCV